ncbi:MAG: hypothetical protein MJZ70_04415 [Bacteroidales bacterium]|nr:hypothetical protein [Bacteroidales bacterium]
MFENGDPRIANNNMKDFFEAIMDWKAAAKLSEKSLIGAGIIYNLNNNDNESK